VAVIIGEMEKINNKNMHDEIHDDSLKLDNILKELKDLKLMS